MHGQSGGTQGIDNDFAVQSFENVGAWILGRNMFGRFGGLGKTIPGKGGGATIRRTIRLFSCSRITRDLPSKWKAAPRSTSSPMDRSLL
jgi:hypothetical protein